VDESAGIVFAEEQEDEQFMSNGVENIESGGAL